MKKTYMKPVTATETLSLAQIIASSPTDSSTPAISGEQSSGGEGLAKDNSWGDLW